MGDCISDQRGHACTQELPHKIRLDSKLLTRGVKYQLEAKEDGRRVKQRHLRENSFLGPSSASTTSTVELWEECYVMEWEEVVQQCHERRWIHVNF